MILDDTKNFNQQFLWEPAVENKAGLKKFKRAVVCGMGGSHLAADVLAAIWPELPLTVWHDYGLPYIVKSDLKDVLIIASSYSGNTEETIDALAVARKKKMNVCAIAAGGTLLAQAKKMKIPYVELPSLGIQPRMALGYSAKAMLAVMGDKKALKELEKLATELRPETNEAPARQLAAQLNGNVPVMYASARNGAIAMIWKIVLDETGKIPAFWNVFSELNHNEMTGFDVRRSTRDLSERMHFMIMHDTDDDARVVKRMRVLQELYRSRALKVEVMEIKGRSRAAKVFSAINLAQWIAYFTAVNYGVEPEQVPMVEEFKKLIA